MKTLHKHSNRPKQTLLKGFAMTIMKSALSSLVVTIFAIGAVHADSTVTQAASMTAAPAIAPVQHEKKPDLVNMVQQHLGHVKAELKLAPQQESAWQAYATRVNAQAKKMASSRAEMQHASHDQTMATPERLESIASHMRERAQDMSALADATKTLFVQLTPAQRVEFDKISENEVKIFHEKMRHMMMAKTPMSTPTASSTSGATAAQ